MFLCIPAPILATQSLYFCSCQASFWLFLAAEMISPVRGCSCSMPLTLSSVRSQGEKDVRNRDELAATLMHRVMLAYPCPYFHVHRHPCSKPCGIQNQGSKFSHRDAHEYLFTFEAWSLQPGTIRRCCLYSVPLLTSHFWHVRLS